MESKSERLTLCATAVVSSAPGSGAATPGAPNLDWAVPQITRTKYLATFQQTDRARTGFIAGVQVHTYFTAFFIII